MQILSSRKKTLLKMNYINWTKIHWMEFSMEEMEKPTGIINLIKHFVWHMLRTRINRTHTHGNRIFYVTQHHIFVYKFQLKLFKFFDRWGKIGAYRKCRKNFLSRFQVFRCRCRKVKFRISSKWKLYVQIIICMTSNLHTWKVIYRCEDKKKFSSETVTFALFDWETFILRIYS